MTVPVGRPVMQLSAGQIAKYNQLRVDHLPVSFDERITEDPLVFRQDTG